MQTAEIIASTQKWITDVVIGCQFCPFAAREVARNSIYYQVANSNNLQAMPAMLVQQCKRLDADESTETSFLILPDNDLPFKNFLQLLSFAETTLKKSGYEGTYQVAHFHPQYRFRGSAKNDAANFTNRSPYPMLQLLREKSVEKALAHYPHPPSSIPKNNVAFARKKGVEFMQALKNACQLKGSDKKEDE